MSAIFYKLEPIPRKNFISKLEKMGYVCLENKEMIGVVDLTRQLMAAVKYFDMQDSQGEEDVCMFWGFNLSVLNRWKLIKFERDIEKILLESGGVEYAEWTFRNGSHDENR